MEWQPHNIEPNLPDVLEVVICNIATLEAIPEILGTVVVEQLTESLVHGSVLVDFVELKHIALGVEPVADTDSLQEKLLAAWVEDLFAGGTAVLAVAGDG